METYGQRDRQRSPGYLANSTNDIFTVGTNSTILHYDGRSWHAMTHQISEHPYALYAVWETLQQTFSSSEGKGQFFTMTVPHGMRCPAARQICSWMSKAMRLITSYRWETEVQSCIITAKTGNQYRAKPQTDLPASAGFPEMYIRCRVRWHYCALYWN